ncbi:MAG: hypothetical protein ACFFCF_12595 [Promethearchaeota archaeon]
MGDFNLPEIRNWLEGLGHTVRVAETGIDAAVLEGADALILSSPFGPPEGIDELSATNAQSLFATIKAWFDQGNKFLWVSGDSDFDGTDWISLNASQLLGELDSVLRFEPAAIEDAVSNAPPGSPFPYRVVANIPELVDEDGAWISAGVEAVLFHGPTCLYAMQDGTPVALEETTVPNVFNIYSSSDNSYILEHDFDHSPVAHNIADPPWAQQTRYVMMAGERNAGPEGNNKVIASGAAPYGNFRPLWMPAYFGVPLDGRILVKQAILWGLGLPLTPELYKSVGFSKADFVFSFDLTGSMGGKIIHVQDAASAIIDDLQKYVADLELGVVTHKDYPYFYEDYHGYTGLYGDPGDYVFQVDLPLPTDADTVCSFIESMWVGGGADVYEPYSRVLYESQFLDWRSDARKYLILFGDWLPHDDDFWEYSTGGDPGPDELAYTDDDLDLQEVVPLIASQGITVLAVDCSTGSEFAAFYQYLADETGGQYFSLEQADLATGIRSLIKAEIQETLTIKAKTETQWALIIEVTNPYANLFMSSVPRTK